MIPYRTRQRTRKAEKIDTFLLHRLVQAVTIAAGLGVIARSVPLRAVPSHIVECRGNAMPEKDALLEQALKQAKAKKMFFAFVPKGAADGRLIVARTKIPAKAIAELKKEIGGANAVTGKCYGGDDGNMVFQVAKAAPTTLEPALKKVVHRDTGLTIKPDVQLVADADVEEVETADAAPTAAGDPRAEFTARLKALLPEIQKIQTTASPAVAQQIKTWASQAAELAGKHDFRAAGALLDKIEAALKVVAAGPVAATASPPTLKSISISPANPVLTGGWQRQFKAMGLFSDGTSKDVTNSVVWSAAPASVISIQPTTGLASANPGAGTGVVTATDASGQIHASANVTVQADPMPTLSPGEDAKAEIFADMAADLEAATPDVAALKTLADKPENAGILDELIESMDDKTPQKVFEAAIEARFGIKVRQYEHHDPAHLSRLSGATAVSPDLPDKSLKRVYELLTKVPLSHVKKNPNLTDIIRFTKDEGGAAWSSTGKVYLYCGRAGDKKTQELNDPSELPEVEDACKAKPGKAPAYFDFATLHEVGHAVDAQNGFMNKHQTHEEYGAWQITNPGDIAKVAAAHFHFDLAYITAKLTDAPATTPKRPDHVREDEWKKLLETVDNWCEGIRDRGGNGFWRDPAKSHDLAIGGRVYQEAYNDQNIWVSYSLAARKKGITGYQFRAPGEWFAELYAAFESGKLKDNHPSMAWLKTL
jgi:hypothetical protein